MSSSTHTLRQALATVYDPELRQPITELGMVDLAVVEQGTAYVTILLTVEGCPLRARIEEQVRAAALSLKDVEAVELEIDYMNAQQREQLRQKLGYRRENPFTRPDSLTQVYAVVSGKGGVGKSSMTANLAAALANRGLTVGLIDADIHGFSIPGILGLDQGPTRMDEMILPPVLEAGQVQDQGGRQAAGCIKVISIGMFLAGNQPVAWRGPMLHRALEQFLTDVHFGALDVLLLDLPPGTGDIAISMAQLLPQAGLLLVSTPQQAAVEVAERAGTLSMQTKQKVVGVIENMAGLKLADGSVLDIFGSGGGELLAQRLTDSLGYPVPLLGSVPLDMQLRQAGDAGGPLLWQYPDSAAAGVIDQIAEGLAHRSRNLSGKQLPLHFSSR